MYTCSPQAAIMYSKKLTIIARGLQLRMPTKKMAGGGGGVCPKSPSFSGDVSNH